MNILKTSEITEVALFAALIALSGAVKLPGLVPGSEFQLSAPLAVAICAVFGFKKYILAGILASLVGLMLGTQNILNTIIAMQFRLVVGFILMILGDKKLVLMLAGPIGTATARLTLSFVIEQAAFVLILAALPGMVFTAFATPILVEILRRIRIRVTS